MKCYICATEGRDSDAVAGLHRLRHGRLHGPRPARGGRARRGRVPVPHEETSEDPAAHVVPTLLRGLPERVDGRPHAREARRGRGPRYAPPRLCRGRRGRDYADARPRHDSRDPVQHRDRGPRRPRRLARDRNGVRDRDRGHDLCARPGLRRAPELGGHARARRDTAVYLVRRGRLHRRAVRRGRARLVPLRVLDRS